VARAHHGQRGLGEQVRVAAHVERQGWIINLAQLGGVSGIVERDHGDAGGAGAHQFFAGKLQRFAGGQRLRRSGRNAGRFQAGQRSLKKVIHGAEKFHQMAGAGGTQAGGESQGNPMESTGVFHSRGWIRAHGFKPNKQLLRLLLLGLKHQQEGVSRKRDTGGM
jgi:hypothetical protein